VTLSAVFKYNPYHDSKGRFTTGGKATAVSPRESRGVDFVSPNKGNLTYPKAKDRLASKEQALLVQYSGKINKALGISGTTASVLGAWSDGAENSTVGVYGDDTSYESIRAAASLKGLLEKQKSVIAFKARKGGVARISNMELTGTLDQHHSGLLEAGIEFHTLQPTKGGVKVWVFQERSDTALNATLSNYAKSHTGSVKTWAGDGEFIGSWDSRADGAVAYRKELSKYVAANPTSKEEIERVLREWRKRSGK
jgi:hypothetical protein